MEDAYGYRIRIASENCIVLFKKPVKAVQVFAGFPYVGLWGSFWNPPVFCIFLPFLQASPIFPQPRSDRSPGFETKCPKARCRSPPDPPFHFLTRKVASTNGNERRNT